jgi:ribosomal protein S18 acetylase RimI-like enzyme
MGDFTIRAATTDDAAGIALVHATSWRETYAHVIPDPAHPAFEVGWRTTMWQENLSTAAFDTVVAVSGAEMIGFAAVGSTPEPGAVRIEELTMLYLLAEAHGSGAGQALLDAVLADRPATLWVAVDNPRAQAFYRRNGFVKDGATSEFAPIGQTVRMVR